MRMFGMKWMDNQTNSLPVSGKYFTALKATTTLENTENEVSIDTEIAFEIQ